MRYRQQSIKIFEFYELPQNHASGQSDNPFKHKAPPNEPCGAFFTIQVFN